MSSSLIEKLHADYQCSLKNKSDELNLLRAGMEEDSQQLVKLLHRLAGSAGMYGFEDISQQAIKLQAAVDSNQSNANVTEEFDALIKLLAENSID